MANCRVMVVDENPAFRDVVVSTIAGRGFEVFPAADGIDALRQIYQVNPDVIVSDAELRDLSGFRFLPFVRRRFPKIGVIALKSETTSAFENKDVVADEVFSCTPFNVTQFIRLVDDFSRRAATQCEQSVLHLRMIKIAQEETKRIDSIRCAICEDLLDTLNRALLDSLLSTTWERSDPQTMTAPLQSEVAEVSLGQALRALDNHKLEFHFERAG